MAKEAPIYDLTLLLSSEAEEDRRKKILADVESAISTAGGSIERSDDWGRRPMAYEIRHQAEADYHLLQFHAPPTLIDELSHTLRVTDGVLRFRVIKVRPGTPPAPSSPPPVVTGAASHVATGPAASAASGDRPSDAPDGVRSTATESSQSGSSADSPSGSPDSSTEAATAT